MIVIIKITINEWFLHIHWSELKLCIWYIGPNYYWNMYYNLTAEAYGKRQLFVYKRSVSYLTLASNLGTLQMVVVFEVRHSLLAGSDFGQIWLELVSILDIFFVQRLFCNIRCFHQIWSFYWPQLTFCQAWWQLLCDNTENYRFDNFIKCSLGNKTFLVFAELIRELH